MMMHRPDPTAAIRSLRSAAPYIRMYKGKTFVVKAGGGVFADAAAVRGLIEPQYPDGQHIVHLDPVLELPVLEQLGRAGAQGAILQVVDVPFAAHAGGQHHHSQ